MKKTLLSIIFIALFASYAFSAPVVIYDDNFDNNETNYSFRFGNPKIVDNALTLEIRQPNDYLAIGYLLPDEKYDTYNISFDSTFTLFSYPSNNPLFACYFNASDQVSIKNKGGALFFNDQSQSFSNIQDDKPINFRINIDYTKNTSDIFIDSVLAYSESFNPNDENPKSVVFKLDTTYGLLGTAVTLDNIKIIGNTNPVPVISSFFLLFSGLLGFICFSRKKN